VSLKVTPTSAVIVAISRSYRGFVASGRLHDEFVAKLRALEEEYRGEFPTERRSSRGYEWGSFDFGDHSLTLTWSEELEQYWVEIGYEDDEYDRLRRLASSEMAAFQAMLEELAARLSQERGRKRRDTLLDGIE
jgi:hypothetical protein